MTDEMPNDGMDREISNFLTRLASDTAGAPSAADVAVRIRSRRPTGRLAVQVVPGFAWVVVVGLVLLALVASAAAGAFLVRELELRNATSDVIEPTPFSIPSPTAVTPIVDVDVPEVVSNGWIAFSTQPGSVQRSETDRSSGGDIYLVRAGTPPRLIVSRGASNASNVCPAFSPDGQFLAYGTTAGSHREVVVLSVAPDGSTSEETRLAAPGGDPDLAPCPAWAADGQQIGDLDRARDTDSSTPLMSPDGDWAAQLDETGVSVTGNGDTKRLLGADGYAVAAWSPDSTQLLVLTDVGGAFRMSAVAVTPHELPTDVLVTAIAVNGERSWPGRGDVSWQRVRGDPTPTRGPQSSPVAAHAAYEAVFVRRDATATDLLVVAIDSTGTEREVGRLRGLAQNYGGPAVGYISHDGLIAVPVETDAYYFEWRIYDLVHPDVVPVTVPGIRQDFDQLGRAGWSAAWGPDDRLAIVWYDRVPNVGNQYHVTQVDGRTGEATSAEVPLDADPLDQWAADGSGVFVSSQSLGLLAPRVLHPDGELVQAVAGDYASDFGRVFRFDGARLQVEDFRVGVFDSVAGFSVVAQIDGRRFYDAAWNIDGTDVWLLDGSIETGPELFVQRLSAGGLPVTVATLVDPEPKRGSQTSGQFAGFAPDDSLIVVRLFHLTNISPGGGSSQQISSALVMPDAEASIDVDGYFAGWLAVDSE